MSDGHTPSQDGNSKGAAPSSREDRQVAPSSKGDDQDRSLSGLAQMRDALPTTDTAPSTPAQGGQPLSVKDKLAAIKANKAAQVTYATASKRNRSSDGGEPVAKDRNRQVGAMEVDTPIKKTFPFRQIDAFSKRCFVQIAGEALVGGIVDRVGWKAFVRIDGGRWGDPSLTLIFKANTDPKMADQPVGDGQDSDATEVVEVRFRPGVHSRKSPSHYLMEDFQSIEHATRSDAAIFPSQVMDTLAEASKKNAKCFRFDSFGYECATKPSIAWSQYEDSGITKSLSALFFMESKIRVTIWISCVLSPREQIGLDSFNLACREKLTPLFQYYDGDHPVLNLHKSEAIDTIGQGMLCIYDTDEEGREDRTKGPRGYSCFPQILNFWTDAEFKICHSMTTVREFHNTQGLAIYAGNLYLGAHLTRGNPFKVERITQLEMTVDQANFRDVYFAHIRMPNRGKGDSPPTEGTRVDLEWDNGVGSQAHRPDPKAAWYGQVVRADPEYLKKTNTNFCVMLKKPANAAPKRPHMEMVSLPNAELYRCYLKVSINEEAPKRELKAVGDFLASSDPVLQALKLALMSANPIPEPADKDIVKLARGPPGLASRQRKENTSRLAKYVEEIKAVNDNRSQTAVLDTLFGSNIRFCVVQGPPGAGKSKTIAWTAWGLVMVGHKLFIFAMSNDALDNLLNTVARARPADSNCRKKKLLRVETMSVSALSTVRRGTSWRSHYAEMNPDDIARLPEANDYDLESDPAIQLAFSQLDTDVASMEEQQAILDKYELYRKTWDMAHQVDENKRTGENVVTEAEMGYRIFELVQQDEIDAKESFDSDVRHARETFKDDQAGLAAFLAELNPIQDRNPSAMYVAHREYYVRNKGHVSKAHREAYESLQVDIEKRVYADSDMVFSTPQNAHTVAEMEYKPNAAIGEEQGNLTVAAMLVALIPFLGLMMFFMFGDPEQLPPTLLALFLNEMRDIAVMSAMGNWVAKGNRYHFLKIQYRMNPEISQWPNEFFYHGVIENHPSTMLDNPIRQAGRAISKLFNCFGADPRGSCYRVMNLPLGVSRLEDGGTSLFNYAHMEAIKEEVRLALLYGVPPEFISILVWYGGQKGLLLRELQYTPDPNGGGALKPYREISTVDAFQGKENRYVISDLVFADSKTGKVSLTDEIWDQVERSVLGREGGKKFGQPTGHVRSGSRLNVGSTRGGDVQVLICQASNMLRTSRMAAGREKSPTAAMIKDALNRNVLVNANQYIDTHPVAVAERAAAGEQASQKSDNDLIAEKLRYVQLAKTRDRRPTNKQAPKSTQEPGKIKMPPVQTDNEKKIAKEKKKADKAAGKQRKEAEKAAQLAKELAPKGNVQPMPRANPAPAVASNVDKTMEEGPPEDWVSQVEAAEKDAEMKG